MQSLASAQDRAARELQRVYERAYAGITRAERQRAAASARAAQQAQAAVERAAQLMQRAQERAAQAAQRQAEISARRQQQVYEQAFAAIGRAEARRATESARLARQAQAAQEQAARAAQRAAEQAADERAREAQRAAQAEAQAARQRQRLIEQTYQAISRAEQRRASDAARAAQAEQRAREAAARAWIRSQVQAIRENQRNQERAAQQAVRIEERQRREQERLARQWARANQQAQREAQERQQTPTASGGGTGAAAFIGGAAGAAAALAVNTITAAFNALTVAAETAAGAYRDFMAEGIRFNAQLETTKLAIQSLIATNLLNTGAVKDVGAAFAVAGPQAQDQLRKLQIEALASTATFEGLAAAFQQAIGPGLAKGLNLDQIRTLTLQIGQAGKALGQSDFELPQEVRAILEGKIDRNARVANALQITSADIAKFKGNADGLFNYLNEKTKAFRLAGDLASQTFAGLLGNAKEAFTVFAAQSSIQTFGVLKATLGDIIKSFIEIKKNAKGEVIGVNIAKPFQDLAAVLDRIGVLLANAGRTIIGEIVSGARQFGTFLADNRDQVDQIFRVLQGIGSDAMGQILETLAFITRDGKEWLATTETTLKIFREWLQNLLQIGKYIAIGLIEGVKAFNTLVRGAYSYWEQVSGVIQTVSIGVQSIIAGMDALIGKTQSWAASLLDPLGIIRGISRAIGGGGFAGSSSSGAGVSGQNGVANDAQRQALAVGEIVRQNALAVASIPRPNPSPGGGKGGGGGRGSDPVAEAIAQRRAEMQRNFEYQKTLLESAQKLAKQKIDEETAANEAAYEDRLISLETYYAKKAELAQRAKNLEIAALELEKKAETERYELAIDSFNQASKIADPKKRVAAEKKAGDDLATSANNLIKLNADLSVARSQSAQAGAQGERELTKALREEAAAYDEILTNIKEMSGDRFGAARDRINAQADAEIEKVRKSLDVQLQEGAISPEVRNQREQDLVNAINRQREIRLADLNIQEKAAAVQATIAQIQATQAEIQLAMQQAGGVDVEIQRAKLQTLKDQLATLQAQRGELATAIQGNPTAENQQILTDVDKQIQGLGNTSTTIAGQIRQNLYGAFTNLFQGLMSGSQSAGQAFAAFAQQVIGSIQQMIAQMLALWLVQKLIGLAFSAAGALAAPVHSGVTGGLGDLGGAGHGIGVPGYAKGGDYPAGQLAVVGEDGPELFWSGRSGTIIPNLGVTRLSAPAAPSGGGSGPGGSGGGLQKLELTHVIVDRRESVSEHLGSAAGGRDVVSVIQRNARAVKAALQLA